MNPAKIAVRRGDRKSWRVEMPGGAKNETRS